MHMNILSMTAMSTLVLNIFLVVYLCRENINIYPYNTKNNDIINFVLSPYDQGEVASDAAVAETELILPSDRCNG